MHVNNRPESKPVDEPKVQRTPKDEVKPTSAQNENVAPNTFYHNIMAAQLTFRPASVAATGANLAATKVAGKRKRV